jgi:uncharacterized membrane protein YdfJ with MMPL/SSD domain
MVRRVARTLADIALRRPWALVAANLAVLIVALTVAAGAPNDLGVGSLRLSDAPAAPASHGSTGNADIVIVTRGPEPASSRVYRVALGVISSQVRTDQAVVGVERGRTGKDGRTTSLGVTLRPLDEPERQDALRRLEDSIDPGPLDVTFGGEVATLDDARSDLSGDFWKLELLALPLVLLVLVASLGLRLAVAPVVCAGTAIAGSLALLRVASLFADPSLLAEAPAAVIGLALGVELSILVVARYRDEAAFASRDEAIRRTISRGIRPLALAGLAAAVVPLGLLATPLDQAPSIAFACAAAAALAVSSALICTPALIALVRAERRSGSAAIEGEPRAARAVRTAIGRIASRRWRTVLCSLLALAALLALARPALHGATNPFSATDLPAGTPARVAGADLAKASPAAAGAEQSLFGDLPLAAGISIAALALVLLAAFRSPRALPLAVVALLPAAAAGGLCVFVFQHGHLSSAISQERQGAIETGALACLAAALAAICAARCITALSAVRAEASVARAPAGAAEAATALTLPATLAATLIAGAAAGVLAGSDLYSAREFGLAVAAGLVIDLIVVRPPVLAALSRWATRN